MFITGNLTMRYAPILCLIAPPVCTWFMHFSPEQLNILLTFYSALYLSMFALETKPIIEKIITMRPCDSNHLHTFAVTYQASLFSILFMGHMPFKTTEQSILAVVATLVAQNWILYTKQTLSTSLDLKTVLQENSDYIKSSLPLLVLAVVQMYFSAGLPQQGLTVTLAMNSVLLLFNLPYITGTETLHEARARWRTTFSGNLDQATPASLEQLTHFQSNTIIKIQNHKPNILKLHFLAHIPVFEKFLPFAFPHLLHKNFPEKNYAALLQLGIHASYALLFDAQNVQNILHQLKIPLEIVPSPGKKISYNERLVYASGAFIKAYDLTQHFNQSLENSPEIVTHSKIIDAIIHVCKQRFRFSFSNTAETSRHIRSTYQRLSQFYWLKKHYRPIVLITATFIGLTSWIFLAAQAPFMLSLTVTALAFCIVPLVYRHIKYVIHSLIIITYSTTVALSLFYLPWSVPAYLALTVAALCLYFCSYIGLTYTNYHAHFSDNDILHIQPTLVDLMYKVACTDGRTPQEDKDLIALLLTSKHLMNSTERLKNTIEAHKTPIILLCIAVAGLVAHYLTACVFGYPIACLVLTTSMCVVAYTPNAQAFFSELLKQSSSFFSFRYPEPTTTTTPLSTEHFSLFNSNTPTEDHESSPIDDANNDMFRSHASLAHRSR